MPKERKPLYFTPEERLFVNRARVLASAGDFQLEYVQFIHDATMQAAEEVVGGGGRILKAFSMLRGEIQRLEEKCQTLQDEIDGVGSVSLPEGATG